MNHNNDFMNQDVYNKPTTCPECGGNMIFKGCGEYRCEKCKHVSYDDYGKVRNYVEKNGRATAAQVAEATGVKQKTIRTMLKESRLEISEDSSSFLRCEMCGKNIRSGRVCPQCEVAYKKAMEEKEHMKHAKMMSGFGAEHHNGEEGAKRFVRDK